MKMDKKRPQRDGVKAGLESGLHMQEKFNGPDNVAAQKGKAQKPSRSNEKVSEDGKDYVIKG